MNASSPHRNLRLALFEQARICVQHRPAPALAELYLPVPTPDPGRDAEFGVVRLEDGSAGLYYAWLGEEQRGLAARFGSRLGAGTPAIELARLYLGEDEAARSIGLAAISAITCWWWRVQGYVPPAASNSFGTAILPGERIGFIGNFVPLVRRLREQGFSVVVVERKPQMWCEAPGLSVTGDPAALLDCSVVIATASMCLNDSLDEMLPYCAGARVVSLIGPTAGFFPEALFERGITSVGGLQLLDAEAAIARMRAGLKWQDCARRYQMTAGSTPASGLP